MLFVFMCTNCTFIIAYKCANPVESTHEIFVIMVLRKQEAVVWRNVPVCQNVVQVTLVG